MDCLQKNLFTIVRVIEEYPDSDKIEVSDGGQNVVFTIGHHDGMVHYCSKPELLPLWKQQGLLTTRFYRHLYGHTDYFFV